jgi:peptide/nickel transport system substrate-binding protein
MHNMRLKKPIVALSAAGLLALAACGGSDNNGSGDNTTPTTPGDTTSTSSGSPSSPTGGDPNANGQCPTCQPPAKAIPGAKTGGTVYVETAAAPATFDPTDTYYVDSAAIEEGLITRELTQYVRDPKTGNMILVPDLATDLGQHNADYTKWTFTIRDGIKYEDGTPITLDDIKYGIERSFDRETFINGANYSNQYFLDGDTYKGPYKSPGVDYKGVTISGQKLTIKMAKPFPDMPYWGSFPAMGPIPSGSASDPAKYKNHPLATGPYKFSSYSPGKSLTLVKNQYWDPKTDPGRHQYPDSYQFTFAQDSAQIDAGLLADTGQFQNTLTYDDVLATDYPKFKTDASDRLTQGPNPCTYIVYPDNRKIKNKLVRQAIGWAYPYKAAWIAGGYIEGVTRAAALNVMPPGLPGRVEYNPLPGHAPASTDAAKAKALLEKAHAVGFKLIFPYSTDVDTSKAVKDQLVIAFKAAGFDPVPYATTSTNARTLISNANAPINLRIVGWCSDWPSGAAWIPPEFQSTNIEKDGLGTNYEAFNEPSVDSQINRIQLLPSDQQASAWNDLEKSLMLKYYPLIPTGYGAVAMAHGSKIMNMFNDPTFGMPVFKDIWVS